MTRKRKERSGGPIGIAKTDRPKRETNTQALEARKQKRLKKRKGLASGTRSGEAPQKQNHKGGKKNNDPRVGSKKPVELVAAPTPTAQPTFAKVKKEKPVKVEPIKVELTLEQELDQLENDARLSALLVRLDNDEALNAAEQSYVDERVERHQFLLAELGYDEEFDEEEYDEDEWDEEMMAQLDAQSFTESSEKLSEEELYERFLQTEKKLKEKDAE